MCLRAVPIWKCEHNAAVFTTICDSVDEGSTVCRLVSSGKVSNYGDLYSKDYAEGPSGWCSKLTSTAIVD